MSLHILKAAAEAENTDGLHLGRLLILLHSADRVIKKPELKFRAVEGISKLAKLDFLLRYPIYLERALLALGQPEDEAAVRLCERTTVETKMIRFRYGPWDSRYRRWLKLLAARNLVTLSSRGQKIEIGLTNHGKQLAHELMGQSAFMDIAQRSNTIVKIVGAMPAARLKDFIYQIAPEITDMKWGDEIVPELTEWEKPQKLRDQS